MVFAAGAPLTAAELNAAVFPPIFHGYASGGQAGVATITDTPVLLNVEMIDTHGGHSISVNTAQYIGPVQGYYNVSGQVAYPGTLALNVRGLARIKKNGVDIPGSKYGAAAATGSQGFASNVAWCSGTVFLNGTTDYVELHATHNSGGAITLDPGSFLKVEFLHP